MNRAVNYFCLFAVCFVAVLHLGTVLKKEDPILKTQTDPIAHREKMEEIKDGEKGAPMPSQILYSKSGFLSEKPVEKKEEESAQELMEPVTEVEEIFEEEKPEAEEEFEIEWWSDESEEEGEEEGNEGV